MWCAVEQPDVKARDDFASLPAERQWGLSSVGSVRWLLAQMCAGGWAQGRERTGTVVSCSSSGAAVTARALSRADPLLPALVPSSPVQGALFFGGRDEHR